MDARTVLDRTAAHVATYLPADELPVIVAVADPAKTKIGISIQRNYPLTLIERSYGIPFGRFRSDAVRLLSDPNELHGYKWSIETHEAVFEADAATDIRLQTGKQRRVPIKLSTGLGNVLQNLRSVAYVDRAPYMVVGERPDHPPPYACLVEYSYESTRRIGVELLLFNELGGCQQILKKRYLASPVEAAMAAEPKFEDRIRWAVSGYPLVLEGEPTTLELTTRNVSDLRHVWKLPRLQKSMVQHLAAISKIPKAIERIEFYFGFDELREKRSFVRATRDEVVTLPLELWMTQEWVETMCTVCDINEETLRTLPSFDCARSVLLFNPDEVADDFTNNDYVRVGDKELVCERGQFYIDEERRELSVRLLPAIYPHHIVGIAADGRIVNISICGLSGRSGISIEGAKMLAHDLELVDALIFDNGNDVFARYEGRHPIAHSKNDRQTRLTAALHFADILDPGPHATCDVQSEYLHVERKQASVRDNLSA